jgi:hypothetical protein
MGRALREAWCRNWVWLEVVEEEGSCVRCEM